MCDQVSDGILDACIKANPNAKVAMETATKSNMVSSFKSSEWESHSLDLDRFAR